MVRRREALDGSLGQDERISGRNASQNGCRVIVEPGDTLEALARHSSSFNFLAVPRHCLWTEIQNASLILF